jgi:hypothetical protein
MISEEAAKKEVRARVIRTGRKWKSEVWDALSTEAKSVRDQDLIKDVVYDYINAYDFDERVNDARRKKPGGAIPKVVPPDNRTRAVEKIAALEAARLHDVQAFRKDVLKGKLLGNVESAAKWIQRQSKKEGLPEGWSEGATLYKPQDRAFTVGDNRSTLVFYTVLKGTGPDILWPYEMAPIKPDGILGRLKSVAVRLTAPFPVSLASFPAWGEQWATTFILTGCVPPINRGLVSTFESGNLPPTGRIQLNVDPRLSPREVAELFAEARKRMLGESFRDKSISDKHLELAVFAAEHCRGSEVDASWDSLRLTWNEIISTEHSDWIYEGVETWNFSKDVLRAWERVSGLKLNKPKFKGRPKK